MHNYIIPNYSRIIIEFIKMFMYQSMEIYFQVQFDWRNFQKVSGLQTTYFCEDGWYIWK